MDRSTRKTIGPWKLGRRIARSGQAEVFEGTRLDEEGGKAAAVKVIRLTDPTKAARFKTEVDSHKALSDEKTANIMPILDYSLQASQGQGYIAMPMAAASLSGDAQFFHRRVELCLSAFIGVVNGLVGAHAKGVIHRDIKPGNILFEDPYLQVPLVSDFGICLLKDTPREERVTAVDETVGAKFFMAPEQEKGGVADVGETADIYAVGKLLHFMITGRYLFREELENAFNEEELKTDHRLMSVHQEILARTIVASPDSRMGTARELLQISRDLLASFRQGRHKEARAELTTLKKAYDRYTSDLVQGKTQEVGLDLDKLQQTFSSLWNKILEGVQNSPEMAPQAALQLVEEQPKLTALAIAMARCDASGMFPRFKRILEFITRATEGLPGYVAIRAIPRFQAGFLYMATSVFSLHFESWKILENLLSKRFEWYYESSRPLYSYGFDHPYFIHSDLFDRQASKSHDEFRGLLGRSEVVEVTGLSGDGLLQAYLRAQMLMCFKAAQLREKGENVRLWADFGRFYGDRVVALLDRVYADSDFAAGLLRSFGEEKDVFIERVNSRLGFIQRHFWGDGGGYIYDSLESWEPRS